MSKHYQQTSKHVAQYLCLDFFLVLDHSGEEEREEGKFRRKRGEKKRAEVRKYGGTRNDDGCFSSVA